MPATHSTPGIDSRSGGSGNDYVRRPHGQAHPPIPIRRWLLFLVLGFLVYEFIFSSRSFLMLHRLRREASMLEERRVALTAELERLTAEKRRLETNAGIEEAAREKHGMARTGEEIYLLPAPEAATPDR
jgi:cell division protein FtsB